MTERAEVLLDVVMDMIAGSLTTMETDQFYSPPSWIMENWWNTLSLVRREITSSTCAAQPVDDSNVQVP